MNDTKPAWLKRSGVPVLILVGVIGVIVTAMILWYEPLLSVFSDRARLSDMIHAAGPFGPLIFIAVQVLATVIAPIPGPAIGIVGGAVFGWLGLVWGLVGSIIGAYVVFVLVRRYGRRLAEKLVPGPVLEKFDFVVNRRGVTTLFLLFLLPIFPDSILCYLAGLTTIPVRTLMVIWTAGRIPTVAVNTMIGEGMSRAAIRPTIVIVLICAVLLAVGYVKRQRIHDFVESDDRIAYVREHWPYTLSRTVVVGVLLLAALAGITYLVLTV